ncbi:hypothetical protein ANCCEY_11257 [Ancylostoma ceylanicum]|uniref:G-protein coupled receptors family 1 profile domain-containing protein n=1 Tax=Ancylostoma ceylanicum TaxID=53326 RepID=A0A0D6LC19_9BILA|nr:hypothetical protein ANCCEY_11257 [Ancylostoma ceylanicum]
MITINVLKSKMYALVRCRATVLSSETLRLHANLIKALTTQSLTPFLHLITYLCYIIEQHIYSNPVTELIIFIPVGVLSIVTPIINIYYIRPYREMFKRCLRYQSKPSEVSRSKENKIVPHQKHLPLIGKKGAVVALNLVNTAVVVTFSSLAK